MTRIELQLLILQILPVLESWFEDQELRRRLGGMLPLESWFSHVQSTPGYYLWAGFEREELSGIVGFEADAEQVGNVLLLVNPIRRGQGYGQALLRAMLEQPETQALAGLLAEVEADNLASLSCFESVGFTRRPVTRDEEGLLTLSYRLRTV